MININLIRSAVYISLEHDFFRVALPWWFVLSSIIQIAIVSFIAFYPRCIASLISKIGCCLYVILELINLVNQLFYMFSGDHIISLQFISESIGNFVLYAPGLLLLTWGCKLWLPCKIVFSTSIVLEVISDMIRVKLIPMYQNYFDYNEQVKSLSSVNEVISLIMILGLLATIGLTIIWCLLKTKLPNNRTQKLNKI